MSTYYPDRWVMVKITNEDTILYKVFACWFGGYAGSDSWQMNSGVTSVIDSDNMYGFVGSSGSVYNCHKESYGMHMYGRGVLTSYIDAAKERGAIIEILPEETNFMEIDYE